MRARKAVGGVDVGDATRDVEMEVGAMLRGKAWVPVVSVCEWKDMLCCAKRAS